MRLANGIIIDKEKTFGVLKFSALRREVHIQNEDGTVSEEIKERTYDLKCKEQGRMIQVSIPASAPLYLTWQVAPALEKMTASSSAPFFQVMSTSKLPLAQSPFTAPSFHASGRAGSNWMNPM